MTTPALTFEALGAAVSALPDNGLAPARRAALERLRSQSLPGPRDEDWKYTDLEPAIATANSWLDDGARVTEPASREAPSAIDAHWLRIVNGRIDETSLTDLPDGVSVLHLSSVASKLQPAGHLGDLNIALLHDGLRIAVSANVEVQKPIGFLVIDEASHTSVSQVRIDIDVAPGGRVAFVEYQASRGAADHYSNSVVNVDVAPGAHVGFVRVQARQREHDQTSHMAVTLGKDSSFEHASFDIGGRLVRNDLAVDIAEAGADARFGGLYLIGDGQHIDNHTRVDHRTGPAISRQEYRGILDGRARGVWNGKAIVHGGADGTDAEQSNHNLLLSRRAEINAKPELEIYADDVKCSHGTTVGQLDETALYYLRTRGIDRREARQMLTRAFAQSTIDRTPIVQLHGFIEQAVADKLGELMHEAGQ